jgi:hypothetical protein
LIDEFSNNRDWLGQPYEKYDLWLQERANLTEAGWRNFWLNNFSEYVEKNEWLNLLFLDLVGPYLETSSGKYYWPILELRGMIKRISEICERRGITIIMNHNYFTPPLHYFADYILEGEKYFRKIDKSYSEYKFSEQNSLIDFKLLTSVYYGPRIFWLPPFLDEKNWSIEEIYIKHYGYMYLFNILMEWDARLNKEIKNKNELIKLKYFFVNGKSKKFVPFWSNNQKYCRDDFVSSVYLGGGKKVYVVYNKSNEKKKLPIENFNRIYLPYKNKEILLEDYSMERPEIEITIEGGKYIIVEEIEGN